MRVSPTHYAEATRAATLMVCGLYFMGGVLVAVSTRRIEITGGLYIAALLTAIIVCNLIIFIFQRITLPKIESQLQAAISEGNGPEFARHIIRREMAKIIQPIGGLALTIGFLAEITVSRLWL
jgi:hypothetical protein